jgi:hypothetical protein
MRRRTLTLAACVAALAGLLAPAALLDGARATPATPVAREAEAVVLTGAQLPTWSRLPATGSAGPWPAGFLDGVRDAHHGTLVVPPDARTGVDPDQVTAYRWDDGEWEEVPVQVDERFPYFLANANSDFAQYSAVDQELTYAFDDENWKKTAGVCEAEYEPGDGPTPDPVPTLDDDDEIAFMARDTGDKAPAATRPAGTVGDRQEVALADPLDPGNTRYVYLFLNPAGSTFSPANGYVTYLRDADADQWIDAATFAPDDPEKLGSSNTGYGPNLSGTVCEGTTVRTSVDRFPRDGVRVLTNRYRWYASGRWMVRALRVRKPTGGFGPDLIDRWKGRAFQQSPDSSISVVGFEDEQVNWEANSALLGERVGPVRAIRETWGADSGTNVTKTETFYRSGITYRYHLRVHPIPPDGIYTSWDYNHGVAVKYYNTVKPNGVDIDGVNDDVGNVDTVGGQPAFFDMNDPTFNIPSAVLNWEQVSGAGDAGSVVDLIELKGVTSAQNPAVVPYYRDDKCLDDGTGDDPVQRPWPGDPGDDPNVQNGYASMAGVPYSQVTCDQKQGAWGSHGVHFFFTGDTDNAFTGSQPLTEVDAVQYQFPVSTAAPTNVGDPYANTVKFRLVPTATPQPGGP